MCVQMSVCGCACVQGVHTRIHSHQGAAAPLCPGQGLGQVHKVPRRGPWARPSLARPQFPQGLNEEGGCGMTPSSRFSKVGLEHAPPGLPSLGPSSCLTR